MFLGFLITLGAIIGVVSVWTPEMRAIRWMERAIDDVARALQSMRKRDHLSLPLGAGCANCGLCANLRGGLASNA